MHDLALLQKIICSASWVLYGNVQQQLRAVKIDIDVDNKRIYLFFYFDGEISQYDERILRVAGEIIYEKLQNQIDSEYEVVPALQRLDFPKPIPDKGCYLYLRDETLFSSDRSTKLQMDYKPFAGDDKDDLDLLIGLSTYGLLGKVRPSLRRLEVIPNELAKVAYFYFYYDGEISEDIAAVTQEIVRAAMEYFLNEYTPQVLIERIDYPKSIPELGTIVYKRDEVILRDEEYEFSEYEERKWVNVDTLTTEVYRKQSFTFDFLMSGIRLKLWGRIRSNYRAIQISIDQFKRQVKLWLQFEGDITNDIFELEELLKKAAFEARYNVEMYKERVDAPAPIIQYGHFLYLDPESAQHAVRLQFTDYNQISEFIKNAVPSSYLRAVTIDVHLHERDVFILFVLDEKAPADEIINVKNLFTKIKDKFFRGFTHSAYSATYASEERIPIIGRAVYLYSGGEDIENCGYQACFIEDLSDQLAGKLDSHVIAIRTSLDHYRKIIYVGIYYDQEPTPEVVQQVVTAIEASCPPKFQPTVEISVLNAYQQIPSVGWGVYRRWER